MRLGTGNFGNRPAEKQKMQASSRGPLRFISGSPQVGHTGFPDVKIGLAVMQAPPPPGEVLGTLNKVLLDRLAPKKTSKSINPGGINLLSKNSEVNIQKPTKKRHYWPSLTPISKFFSVQPARLQNLGF